MKIYKYLLACTLSSVTITHARAADIGSWPSAVEDIVTLTSNQRVYLPVLDNDVGEDLTLFDVNTTTVSLGSVEMDATKKAVYYQSADNFTGEDSFWYAFTDAHGRTNSAKVSLNVIESVVVPPVVPPAEPEGNYDVWPSANTDIVSTEKNTSITVPVLANDVGQDLALIEVNTSTVAAGTATIQGDSIIYSPLQNYTGEDSFWYAFTDARGRTNSTQVKITVNDDSVVTPPPPASTSFELVTMHDDVLKRRSHIYGESGGTVSMRISRYADEGDTEILMNQSYNVKEGQLITYLSEEGNYHTVTVSRITGQTLELNSPLEASIDVGDNVWNFYYDGAHPNLYGFRALADFALNNQDENALNQGKHVLLGDSWFSTTGVAERLTEKLDNAQIINKGTGGNTSANLLARFDRDVASQNPDVVWLIAGTNDYYQGVTVEDFTQNMSELISKIDSLGAKAVVIDASVAPLMSGSQYLTEISHEYAAALKSLLAQ
jgi:hypothetical protein